MSQLLALPEFTLVVNMKSDWHTGAGGGQPGVVNGRKVYFHHRDPEGRGEHWREPCKASWSTPVRGVYREYLRFEGRRDDQNRSILGWVLPDARFAFETQVWKLTEVELGALIWLLELPEECRFRLGAGKPLGFGSVRLKLERETSSVVKGAEVAEHYRSLGARRPGPDPRRLGRLIETFREEVGRAYVGSAAAFEQVPFIAAFLAAARGKPGPVHYPRLGKALDSRGRNFQWFRANARGRRLAVPEATSSDLLPTDRIPGIQAIDPRHEVSLDGHTVDQPHPSLGGRRRP